MQVFSPIKYRKNNRSQEINKIYFLTATNQFLFYFLAKRNIIDWKIFDTATVDIKQPIASKSLMKQGQTISLKDMPYEFGF